MLSLLLLPILLAMYYSNQLKPLYDKGYIGIHADTLYCTLLVHTIMTSCDAMNTAEKTVKL
jgi:hypothetical protein